MGMTAEKILSGAARPRLRALTLVLVALALAIAVAGCIFGGGRVMVTDDAGRQITLEQAPEKIVSMAPSNTEILFALGLGERVVGVTTYCDYPDETADVAKVGDSYSPDYEKIISLEPDLVLAVGTADSELVKGLEGYGLTVCVLQAETVAQVPDDIELVGQVTHAGKAAKTVADDVRARIKTVSDRISGTAPADRPVVFWCLDDLLWTVGPGSFVNDVIAIAGGQNIGATLGQAYGQFSLESLLEADPGVIIIPILDPAVPGKLAQLDGWETLTAVKSGRVYQIDPDIVSRPGPRIAEAVEKVAGLLYPSLFGDGGQ
jgi:iron complex transport system substrate-binding protein